MEWSFYWRVIVQLIVALVILAVPMYLFISAVASALGLNRAKQSPQREAAEDSEVTHVIFPPTR